MPNTKTYPLAIFTPRKGAKKIPALVWAIGIFVILVITSIIGLIIFATSGTGSNTPNTSGNGMLWFGVILMILGAIFLYKTLKGGEWIMLIGIMLIVLPMLVTWIGGKYDSHNAKTPGTAEVTASIFVGRADGSQYTLSDVYWTTFEWPDNGYCIQVPGNTAGVIDRANDGRDEYALLSAVAGKTVHVHTLAPGESLIMSAPGEPVVKFTCPKRT
ncbi:MAG: hypothetical protein ACI9H6_000622 [Patiriisocius sp.]|jgi:hypothetical protein